MIRYMTLLITLALVSLGAQQSVAEDPSDAKPSFMQVFSGSPGDTATHFFFLSERAGETGRPETAPPQNCLFEFDYEAGPLPGVEGTTFSGQVSLQAGEHKEITLHLADLGPGPSVHYRVKLKITFRLGSCRVLASYLLQDAMGNTAASSSGETANFLAGGEFPIPIAQGGGQ